MSLKDRCNRMMHSMIAAAGACAALSIAAPAVAQNPPPAQVYAQLGDQLAVDDKCKVLDSGQRLAIELFAQEIRAMMTAADQAAADQWLANLRTELAAVPCTDARLVASAKGIQATAADRQALWAARVQAVGNLRANELWATMGDAAGSKRPAANSAMTSLAARNPAAAQQFATLAATEAKRALGILCPSLSTNAAQCPALPSPPNAAEAAFAKGWLERVEQYAATMPGARADGQPVLPPGSGGWSELLVATTVDMALGSMSAEMPCDASSYVVRPAGPLPTDATGAVAATVFGARDGLEVGRGEIYLAGGRPMLRGAWVESAGAQTMGLLRCAARP